MKKTTVPAGIGRLLLLFLWPLAFGCKRFDEHYVNYFPLYVVETSPLDASGNFSGDGDITATLNQSIDTARFKIELKVSTGDTAVQGRLKIEDSLVRFSPQTELVASRAYTASISVTEKYSPAQPYTYQWRFTTKAPDEYRLTQRSNRVTDFVRDGSASMQLDDYLFSFGGWTDNGGAVTYSDVYRSNGDLSNWTKLPDAPWHSRHVFGCVKKDGKVWVLGGDNLNPTWDVWNSADGLSWNKVGATDPDPVGQRIYAGYTTHTVAGKEWLYIIGGYGHKDVLRSLDGIKWETVATNVAALASANEPGGEGFSGSAVSLNGNLYLVCGGGGTAWGPPRKSVFVSEDDGVSWKQLPDFPGAPRRYTNVTVYDGKIWVVGGYDDFGVGNLADVWYMTKCGAWHQVQTPSDYIGRHATAVAVYNKQLAITCGNYHNDCWVVEKVK